MEVAPGPEGRGRSRGKAKSLQRAWTIHLCVEDWGVEAARAPNGSTRENFTSMAQPGGRRGLLEWPSNQGGGVWHACCLLRVGGECGVGGKAGGPGKGQETGDKMRKPGGHEVIEAHARIEHLWSESKRQANARQ